MTHTHMRGRTSAPSGGSHLDRKLWGRGCDGGHGGTTVCCDARPDRKVGLRVLCPPPGPGPSPPPPPNLTAPLWRKAEGTSLWNGKTDGFPSIPGLAVKNGNVPAANALLTATAPARGFPKFPESPRPCSLGLRSPWGVDGQGRSRKAWRGGHPGQPHSLCPHRHFSPDPSGQQGLRMSEARDSCGATHPAPLPQSQALFSAQKAWSKAWESSLEPAPRRKENIVYRQKQSRMQGRGQASWGSPALGLRGGTSPPDTECVPTPKLTLCSCLCADRQNTTGFVRQLDGTLLAPGACRPVVRRWPPAPGPGPAAHQPCYLRPVTPLSRPHRTGGFKESLREKGRCTHPGIRFGF